MEKTTNAGEQNSTLAEGVSETANVSNMAYADKLINELNESSGLSDVPFIRELILQWKAIQSGNVASMTVHKNADIEGVFNFKMHSVMNGKNYESTIGYYAFSKASTMEARDVISYMMDGRGLNCSALGSVKDLGSEYEEDN